MAKNLFFLSVFLCFAFNSYAQQADSSTFVYLKNGNYVFGESVRIKIQTSRFFLWEWTDHKVYLDNKVFNADKVGFIHNEPYPRIAVVEHISRDGQPDFAERIRKGKLNLYQAKENIQYARYTSETDFMKKSEQKEFDIYYFNTGFNEVQKFKYSAFREIYRDHPTAARLLNKSYWFSVGYYTFGFAPYASYLGKFAYSYYYMDKEFVESLSFDVIRFTDNHFADVVINLTLCEISRLLALYMQKLKYDYMIQSVDMYNKFDP
ncbi:MAG: hypothetical protein R6U19_09130 [Bacteroidales bacterium]